MKLSEDTIEKVKANEYDINAVEEILKKIIKRDFKGKWKVRYKLDENYKDQPGYDKDSPNTSIAYTKPISEKETLLVADIPTFMALFGTGVENHDNITFPRLNLRHGYSANNYFKIFKLLFHELEHVNQKFKFNEWNDNIDLESCDKEKIRQQTQLMIMALSDHFIYDADYELYLANHELVGIEHQAETEAFYNTIKLFEQYFPEQFDETDAMNLLLKALLNEYEIDGKKVISPYEKFLEVFKKIKISKPYSTEDVMGYKKYANKHFSVLDNYTLLSYGMPVDKDLYLEVKNSNIENFNSVTDLKKYVKKL